MATNNEQIKSLNIKALFESDDKYIIPIYQRNYAWQKAQVVQLIQDIVDVLGSIERYYIGTLVVYKRIQNNITIYETIDGQQRLTTLSILLSVLKNMSELNFTPKQFLTFESRTVSKNTLNAIYEGKDLEKISSLNPTMKQAYIEIKKKLSEVDFPKEEFVKFLLKNVEILRVEVPEDTDLNHYFEIMNSRGEQLEKHEVLKANLMSVLDEKDRSKFAKIWDACSDMSRYVQYGFNTDDRKKIFGKNWKGFEVKSFDDISSSDEDILSNSDSITLEAIIKDVDTDSIMPKDTTEKDFERFVSPINFQNFLLQVLRIQFSAKGDEIPLDDKKLINTFSVYLEEKAEAKEFVKEFAFYLLKMKYLFDNFIIKRDYSKNSDDGEWSLLRLFEGNSSAQYNNTFNEKNNKQILMLLSMFHVSNPSQNYKHWLTGVLNFLNQYDNVNEINSDKYIKYLEQMAKLFLMNRYLVDDESEYSKIIFDSSLKINKDIDKKKLNQGVAVENFIFNYLDYLLWEKEKEKFSYFHFSFSNSVEHFYPQHPIDGHKPLEKGLDDFGNLCLISVSKNAKLNNHPPKSKKAYYPNGEYDSIKQHIMMERADEWDEKCINEHQEQMEKILFSEKLQEA